MLVSRMRWIGAVAVAAAFGIAGAYAAQQAANTAHMEPVNKLPNPYKSIANWAKFPGGRTWGSTAGVDIAPDGKTVWAVDRCGSNTCVGSNLDPILKFDTNGNLLFSFGKGLFAFPHGIHVDSEENIWVTDTILGDGRGKGSTVGQTVQKFDKNGKLLMTLGTPGASGNDEKHFNAPSDVVVAPNGDIFVSDGHGPGTNERIVKFDKTGKFIKAWGHPGTGPGAFSSLHALEMDSRGRLFVGNRDNNRIDIFDQDGKLLDIWYQFSPPGRHPHRSGHRHDVRHRFGVGLGLGNASGLDARHPHRQRQGRFGQISDPRSRCEREGHERRGRRRRRQGRRRGGQGRGHLRRRGRAERCAGQIRVDGMRITREEVVLDLVVKPPDIPGEPAR